MPDVENHLSISAKVSIHELQVLEQAGVAHYDDDWGRDSIVVGNVGIGWPIVVDLVKFNRLANKA